MNSGAERRGDLDAYFERIGYVGDSTPTLEALRQIHTRHVETIPFENLNPLLKWPVRLDTPSLVQKMIRDRRGGYCFEQNLLLWHMLETLGFSVHGHAARVMWATPEGAVLPRGHMLLRVAVEREDYIADVAFGAVTLTVPLRLEPGVEQPTTHEPFRLLEAGGEFTMQALVRTEWRSLYRFGMERYYPADYEVPNWYASTHPQSRFVNDLTAARTTAGRRVTLRNREFAVHRLDGRTERRPITDASDLERILVEQFQIELPKTPELAALLQRLTAQP